MGCGAIALLGVFLLLPSAAWAGAQWTLAEGGGVTCFNLLVDAPVEGPRIMGARQILQEEYADRHLLYVPAEGAALTIGERLQVVRNTGEIDHPATEDSTGHVLEILGVVEVVDVNAEHGMLRVLGACREFELGDVLRPMPDEGELPEDLPRMPVFDHARLVTPSDADAFLVLGALESVIESEEDPERVSETQYQIYAQRDLLVMDQGADATWQRGDVALLYRDRVYADSSIMRDSLLVPTVLGRGVVVRTDLNSAVLQVVDSVDEVQIGDRARNIGSIWEFVNTPPTILCFGERDMVRYGESIRLTAEVSDPNDDPMLVTWRAGAGSLSAEEGLSVTWTAAALDQATRDRGVVEIYATVDDGREDGRVECLVALAVAPPPPAAAPTPGAVAGAEVLDFVCPEIPVGVTETDNRCKAVLDDVALRMRQDPRATAEIVGHSDSSGSADTNEQLSAQRAEQARVYLVETHGIEASRIGVSGVGGAQPIADNETPEGRLRNRRIEVRVTLPGGD